MPVCASSKRPGLGGVGAAEGALLVAEQLAFHQQFGKRAAVDIHPGFGAAQRHLVDGARHDLLAGAGLAGDEHGHRSSRDPLRGLENACHGVTGDDRRHSEIDVSLDGHFVSWSPYRRLRYKLDLARR